MIKGLGVQRLVALFFAGMVLFNFPLLALWDRDVMVLGVPVVSSIAVSWLCLWLVEPGHCPGTASCD